MRRWIAAGVLSIALAGCAAQTPVNYSAANDSFANGSYDDALAAYNAAATAMPNAPEPAYDAANTHYRQEAYDQAQQLLQSAQPNATGDLAEHVNYNLGNSAYQQQQWDAAIAAYEDALRLDPNDADAKYNLELALLQKQQPQGQQTPTPQATNQATSEATNQATQQSTSQATQQSTQQATNQAQSGTQSATQQATQQATQDQASAQATATAQAQQNQAEPEQTPTAQPTQGAIEPSPTGQATQTAEALLQPTATPGPDQQLSQTPGAAAAGGEQGTPTGTPGAVVGMTAAQAQQLLQAIAGDTETIQEHLNQHYVVPGSTPEEDW